jgi:hypothetical protein
VEEFTYKKTTKVPPERSAADVMRLLGLMGATKIQTEFDSGEMVGMKFSVIFDDQELHYKMPIRWREIAEKWKDDKRAKAKQRLQDGWEEKIEQQALWAAWRIALEWLKIQMSFVQCGARDAKEVFMADMIVDKDGSTLGEKFLEGTLPLMIEAPKD